MRRREFVYGLAGLMGVLVVGCNSAKGQFATPAPGTLPEASAPFGLSGLELPGSRAEVCDHFSRLPRTIHGFSQNAHTPGDTGRTRVSYGPADPVLGAPLVLQAIDFRQSDFFPPGFTPFQYVAAASGSDDSGAISFGQDHNVAWLQAETFAASAGQTTNTPTAVRPLHTIAWGEVDGSILFTAAASSYEGLAALVEAFVAAAD